MLNFVGKAFRTWINAILWINIFVFMVIGSLLFYYLFDEDIFVPVGMFIGAFIGLIINILLGGFIANFLNMVDNIEKITKDQNIQN